MLNNNYYGDDAEGDSSQPYLDPHFDVSEITTPVGDMNTRGGDRDDDDDGNNTTMDTLLRIPITDRHNRGCIHVVRMSV